MGKLKQSMRIDVHHFTSSLRSLIFCYSSMHRFLGGEYRYNYRFSHFIQLFNVPLAAFFNLLTGTAFLREYLLCMFEGFGGATDSQNSNAALTKKQMLLVGRSKRARVLREFPEDGQLNMSGIRPARHQ
jgi:hypothetical protein